MRQTLYAAVAGGRFGTRTLATRIPSLACVGWLRPLPLAALDLGGASVRRVFAVDVLTCPHCGGPSRLIAQLTDPVVVRKILAHLGHLTEPPRPGPARSREQLDCA